MKHGVRTLLDPKMRTITDPHYHKFVSHSKRFPAIVEKAPKQWEAREANVENVYLMTSKLCRPVKNLNDLETYVIVCIRTNGTNESESVFKGRKRYTSKKRVTPIQTVAVDLGFQGHF